VIEYSHRVVAAVPGLEAKVDLETLKIEFTVKKDATLRGLYGRLFGRGRDDVHELAASLALDINGLEEASRKLARSVLPHLEGYERYAEFIHDIPLIVLADSESNALARSEGIVAIKSGLLQRSGYFIDLVMMFLSLSGLPSFRSAREDLYKRLFVALGIIRDEATFANCRAIVREFVRLKKELMTLRWAVPFDMFTKGLWIRFHNFVVAHEYGHILLNHFAPKSRFDRRDVAPKISRTMCEELEADLYAARAVDRMVRAAMDELSTPQPSGSLAIGWQIAVCFYCWVLGKEDNPIPWIVHPDDEEMVLSRIGPTGYPDSLGRLSQILTHLFSDELSAPDCRINGPYHDLLIFHNYIAVHCAEQK